MYPLIVLLGTLLVLLQFTPLGEPIRERFGMVGIVVVLGFAAAACLWLSEYFSEIAINGLFSTKGRRELDSRRRAYKWNAVKTDEETNLDAMRDEDLEKWIEDHPGDALAVEIMCERHKAKGNFEAYARECEYLLTLPSKLSVEEKAALYNGLADLYLGRLNRPYKAIEVLTALQAALPRSYQAVLARRRIEELNRKPVAEESETA